MRTFCLLFISIICSAILFPMNGAEIDGLYYSLSSNGTAKVTYKSLNGDNNYLQGSVTIPEKVSYNGKEYTVTSIGSQAFRNNTELTEMILPNTISDIGVNAFINCSGLINIDIKEGVKEFGEGVFSNCSGLKEIILPETTETISSRVFQGCSSLEFVKLPTDLQIIPLNTFYECVNLKTVELPSNLQQIGDAAFSHCSSLETIILPTELKILGKSVFSGCSSLVDISLPASIEEIGNYLFRDCISLKEMYVPVMGNLMFYGCTGLEKLTVGNNIKEIPIQSFQDCFNLRYLVIGESVGIISASLYTSPNLEYIECLCVNPPTINIVYDNIDMFNSGIYDKCILTVPDESLELYKTTNPWKNFFNIQSAGVELPGSDEKNQINIYNLSGMKVGEVSSGSMMKLPQGYYIIRTNNESKKILIK